MIEEKVLLSEKNFLITIVGVFLVSAALVAHSETKIGVANVQQAILQSEAGKKLVEQINASFSEQDEALKERQAEITALLEKLKKDTELMSEQEFQSLLNEITQKRGELAQVFQQLNRVRTEQIERVIQSLGPRAQEAIEALVLSDKYDLILRRENTLYRHELYDVTSKLTEKMNSLEQ
jgi:outer membrane protein